MSDVVLFGTTPMLLTRVFISHNIPHARISRVISKRQG